RAGGEAARTDEQGDVPPVVDERRLYELDLADDLCEEVQRVLRLGPVVHAHAGPVAHEILPGSSRPGSAAASGWSSNPWNGERSPASQASRRPGAARSQSGRTSALTARRSCHRSTTER